MYEFRHIDELLRARWSPLDQLGQTDAAYEGLIAGGLSDSAARASAPHVVRCASHLATQTGPSALALASFVPGRIEVLGKHTDYAGGGSLICSVQRGISVVAVPRTDRQVSVYDVALDDSATLSLSASEPSRPGHWSDYAVAASRRLSRDFSEISRGVDIAFSSDLPRASGLSSSSALVVGFALTIIQANELHSNDRFSGLFDRPEDLAQYLGAVENGLPYLTLRGDTGVGTFGGSEDHTAILCSQPGLMKWYSYCPVRFHEAVAPPEHHVFVVAFSGTHAAKTGSELDRYNYLSDSTAAIAATWRHAMDRDEPHLGAISAIPGYSRTEVALALREFPHERYTVHELTDRLDHFHHENNLILPSAINALEEHDIARFGEAVDRSQHLAETLLRNQTDETMHLTRSARELGAVAASAFGAGFGGSVWAMVDEGNAERFAESWASDYAGHFPSAWEKSAFFVDTPGPAAFQLELDS